MLSLKLYLGKLWLIGSEQNTVMFFLTFFVLYLGYQKYIWYVLD